MPKPDKPPGKPDKPPGKPPTEPPVEPPVDPPIDPPVDPPPDDVGDPALPLEFVDTTYVVPTGNIIISNDLQTSLQYAQQGDQIMLQPAGVKVEER